MTTWCCCASRLRLALRAGWVEAVVRADGEALVRLQREERLLDPFDGRVDAAVGDAEHVDPLLRRHHDDHGSASAAVLRDQYPDPPGCHLGRGGPSVEVPDETSQYFLGSTPQEWRMLPVGG